MRLSRRFMPTKARIPLPSNLEPLTTKCVQFNLPDDPEWLGMFWGALYHLTVWTAYKRSGDTSGADVASIWSQVIADARVSECGAGTNCPNWYLDETSLFGMPRSVDSFIDAVPDCQCPDFPHFYYGKCFYPPTGLQDIWESGYGGYDAITSDPVGGHFCRVQAHQIDNTIANVWTVYTEPCIGTTLVETFGGTDWHKDDFEAKGIYISSLAPFEFAMVIDGEWTCGVA